MENATSVKSAHSVIFTSPRAASYQRHDLNAISNQVLLRSVISTVSTGTELLVYTGQVLPDMPLDSKFESQANALKYPCKYGYCLVAKVEEDPTSTFSENNLVFTFREHTSRLYEKPHSLIPVPMGVSALDAVFIPFVETALCFLHDASILPGEKVCVVGQGSVGLITTAVLRAVLPYSMVHTLDINQRRCQRSLQNANASASSSPLSGEPSVSSIQADVSIDVSSSSSGLMTAIDATRDYGRVIIGSWYGSKEVKLSHLGGRFHRSHLQLISSQVSDIPSILTSRWTKKRRMDLAWKVLRDVKPSQVLKPIIQPVNDAPRVYEELLSGKIDDQVVFSYETNSD